MKIVRTRTFERSLKKLGASESDILVLEEKIAAYPEAGDVIPGLDGARKVRFSMKGKGKSGGGRAIYLVIWLKDTVYLLLAYSKSSKEDLTDEDERVLTAIIRELKNA